MRLGDHSDAIEIHCLFTFSHSGNQKQHAALCSSLATLSHVARWNFGEILQHLITLHFKSLGTPRVKVKTQVRNLPEVNLPE